MSDSPGSGTDPAEVSIPTFERVDRASAGEALRRLPVVTGRAIRLVWRAARPELLTYTLLETASGLGIGLQLLLARRVLQVVAGSTGPVTRSVGDIWGVLVALALITAGLGFAASTMNERRTILAELVQRYVHAQVIDAVSGVDLAAFESPTFHDRLRRAKVNAIERSWSVTYSLVQLGSGATGIIAIGAVLVGIQAWLVPLVVLAYVPLWLATTKNSRAGYAFAFEMTPGDRERMYLNDVLTGKSEAKEIRLFDLSGFLRERYDRLYDLRIAELRKLVRRRMRRALVGNAGNSIALLIGVGIIVQLALTKRITTADAGIAAVALQQLGGRLRSIDASAGSLYECSLFLDDLVTFIDLKRDAGAAVPAGAAPSGLDRIRVENVSFVYVGSTRPVLKRVSLEIGAGEVIALVGQNGSGKTTLAKILCGLYQPTSGRVLWNDEDIAGMDAAALRRLITAIFQDFVRYELSARDNIGLGDHERADDEPEVRRAARRAGIDDVVAGLPEGYATRLSRSFEGGTELSIGQWQRIALARAFMREAPLVVLDEPTAALDAEAEHELLERLRELHRGRAVLLISHRFSSVRLADRIYVLEQGSITEHGTHRELVDLGGRYARMFAIQAAGYLDQTPHPIGGRPQTTREP